MEKPKTTPKDFFFWAGAMIALYWSVSAFIFLIFDYITFAYPDPLNYYASDPYQSGVSFEMSSLIVLFPVFIILMWLIHRDIAKDHTRSAVWVRRWALVLTLFVAALSMIVDLIVLIHSFLNGDAITAAFVLKVVVVLLVAAAAFMHFIADYWGYWEQNPSRARSVGYASILLVVLTIVAGFLILGTPGQARLMRFDQAKITDLQNIQSEITTYYQQKQALPATLSDLGSEQYFTEPMDAQSGQEYGYKIIKAPYTFELCATFNEIGDNAAQYGAPALERGGFNSWTHLAGPRCFFRTVDPSMYPPLTTAPATPAPAPKAIQ